MSLLAFVLMCSAFLLVAYFGYGGLLAKLFKLDPNAVTPAVEMRDDVDYVPIDKKFLLGQHFSAIAAAGPIVGPILAASLFGWGPALLWILIGSVFIGGVHDMGSLVASVRHKARSIAEIVSEYMSRRSYILFLVFVYVTCIYIVVAFTDVVSSSFVGKQTLENGVVISGGGVASSSLLYLALPVIMSLLMRYAKMPLWLGTIIFVPLIGVAIWVGQYIPLDLATILGVSDAQSQKVWDGLLIAYCFVASIIPMWLLLQTRGYLGGFFLYIALAGGVLGVIFGGETIQYPFFKGWVSEKGEPLFPLLFIVIACGACSGFHSLVSAGTTSKQLKTEPDTKPIGYGGMLLEAMVGVISLCCIMMFPIGSSVFQGGVKPNLIYGSGMGAFLGAVGIPPALGISFGLLAFTTFVYDTLDVAMRLARYILQELTGMKGRIGRYVSTAVTAIIPLIFVTDQALDAAGNPIPAWKVFWQLFGATNQLLAAITLIVLTVWLRHVYKARWVWAVTGVPTVFMFVMSSWAILRFIRTGFVAPDGSFKVPPDPAPWVAVLLSVLSVLLFAEAIKTFIVSTKPSPK